ncbi:MAG: 3-isopropylmalate dehydrogenase [Acidobacteriota bacterium]|nr:3-isopropylmalate dehydrogenase [Blastocatellia bacterium]MDW8413383.1 3-isopropylmalate dehydrogenase [Acidobacteriota bacterium]
MKHIAIIPGDGIGVEVTREAVKVLSRVQQVYGFSLQMTHFDWGAEKYLREGVTLPEGALEMLSEYDAIFAGAFGDPRVPDMKHAADILLGLRFGLDLYINLRPVKLLHEGLTPLKGRSRKDIDFVVFRENTEGMYVNSGGFFKKGTPDEIAIQEELNTRKGVERIIVAAFEYAVKNGRKRVTMVDKSNVLRYGHDLWQRTFAEVAKRYPAIEANTQYVDATAMWMVLKPEQFDVIVTNNMFGDIITDLGAALQGGLGMAASGNIHPGRVSLFEPVHGSAPKYAGKNVSNPMGAILTAAMMLEYIGYGEAAKAIEQAVVEALAQGSTTRDIGGRCSTSEVGDAICALLK